MRFMRREGSGRCSIALHRTRRRRCTSRSPIGPPGCASAAPPSSAPGLGHIGAGTRPRRRLDCWRACSMHAAPTLALCVVEDVAMDDAMVLMSVRNCHVCAGTRLAPTTSAQGLGLTPAASAPGLRPFLPHLDRRHRHRCRICTTAKNLWAGRTRACCTRAAGAVGVGPQRLSPRQSARDSRQRRVLGPAIGSLRRAVSAIRARGRARPGANFGGSPSPGGQMRQW